MPNEQHADINQDEIVTIVDNKNPKRGRRQEEIETLSLKKQAKNDSRNNSAIGFTQNTQNIKGGKHRNLYSEHLSIGSESDEKITLDESEDSICEIPIPPKPKPPTIDLDYSESSTSSDSDTSTEIITKEKAVKSCKKIMCKSKSKNQMGGGMEESVGKNKRARSSGCNNSKSSSDESMTESEKQNWDVIPGNQINKDKPTTSSSQDVTMSELPNNLRTDVEQLLINAVSNRSLLDVDESRAAEALSRTSENRKRAVTDSEEKYKHRNSPKKAKRSDDSAAAGSSSSKIPQQNKENTDKQRNCATDYFFKPMTDEMENYYNKSWGGETFNIDALQRQMPRDPRHWAVLKEDLLGYQHRRARYWTESKCMNCNHTGHRIKECPEKKKLPSCHMCGAPGHREPRCPHKMCLGCGKKQETYMQICNGCRRAFCNGCQSYGHVENNCPDLWRRYHITTSHRNMNIHLSMENVMKPQRFLSCCNCAKRGHDSTTCNSYRWSRHFPTPSYVTNYTTGPSYGEHRILEDIEFPSEVSDQTETEKRQTDGNVARTSSSSNEEITEKSNADNVTKENSEVDEVLQDMRTVIDENVENAEEDSEEQRKCSKKKPQKKDKPIPTCVRAAESEEILFTLESKLLNTDVKQTADYCEHEFPLRVAQYDLLVNSEFLHNITSQFPMKLEIKRLENRVITLCVGSAYDLQYPIFLTIMDWLQRPLDEQSRFLKLNLPTKKQDLVKLLTEKLAVLRQDIGDPFKLFAKIKRLKNQLNRLQQQSEAGQKPSTSSKQAYVEELAEFQSRLNMVLFGQVKLNKSDKSCRFLKSALLDMEKAPRPEYVCASTYLQLVHHYNIIFAAYTPDKLPDLLDSYFQKYSSQGPNRKQKRVPSIYETDKTYFNFIEKLYRANLKLDAYSAILEKSKKGNPDVNISQRASGNGSQSTGTEHAHESTTCDNNPSSGNVSTPSSVTNCTTGPTDGEHHTLKDVEILSEARDQTETEKKQTDSSVAHISTSSNEESNRKLNTDEVTKDVLKVNEFLGTISKEIDKNVEKAEELSKKQKISNEEETQKSDKLLPTNFEPVKNKKFSLTFTSQLLNTESEQAANFGEYKVPIITKSKTHQKSTAHRLADSLSHDFFLNLTSLFPMRLNINCCRDGKMTISIASTRDLHVPIQQTIMDWINWRHHERDRFVNLSLPMMKNDLVRLLTEKLDELKQDLGDPMQLYEKVKRLNRDVINFKNQSQSKHKKKIRTCSEQAHIVEELTKSQCKLNMILFGQITNETSETSCTFLRNALCDMQKATSPSHICPAMYLQLVHHYNIIFAAYTPERVLVILRKYWRKYSGQNANVKFKKKLPAIDKCNTTYANFIREFKKVNQNQDTNPAMVDGSHQIIPQNVESINWEKVRSIFEIPVANYNNTNHNHHSNLPSAQIPFDHSWNRQENNYHNSRYNFGENSGSQWYRGTVQNNSQQHYDTALDSCGLQNACYPVGRDFSNVHNGDYNIKSGGHYTDENMLMNLPNETISKGFENSSGLNVESNSSLGSNIWQEGCPLIYTSSQDMFFSDTRADPSQNFLHNGMLDVHSRPEIESRNKFDVNGPSTSGTRNSGNSAERRKIVSNNKKKKKKQKDKGSKLPLYLQERVKNNIAKYIDIGNPCVSQAATAVQRKLRNNDLTLRCVSKFEKLVERKLGKTDHLL